MSKGAADQKPEHKPEQKKDHPKPEAHEQKKGKGHGHAPAPGGCAAWGCKAGEKRFSFCDEHFEQFKFGLIKKSGEPVSDYEKKFEHYVAYKAKLSAQKVA